MLVPGMSVYVREVPEYRVENGHVHICMCGTELVMPVSAFMQGMARARKVLDVWFESQRPKVVPMREARQ